MQLNLEEINSRSKCSISCTLDIIGDKWSLLIIRDAIILKKKSFNEFRNSAEKIASNILTNRMEKLVRYGIMSKTQNPDNKLKFDYLLTDKGKKLEPILMALAEWGYNHIEGTNNIQEQKQKLKEN